MKEEKGEKELNEKKKENVSVEFLIFNVKFLLVLFKFIFTQITS